MTSIDLVGVHLNYPIYDSRARSIKQALLTNLGGRLHRSEESGRIVVQALRDITLSLRPGERVGLVGRNGAGKSTLLKVMAGVYEPPLGIADIRGRIATLLDVTMGMDFEATGYDNVIMRGVFLGMTYAEARDSFRDIEEFTELGEYLALPMRTYSAGMALRLALAIATSADADILVIDEVIGAGDAAFARKARDRIEKMIQRAKILVIASHDDGVIMNLCTRAVVLSGGQISYDGPVQEALDFYRTSIAAVQ